MRVRPRALGAREEDGRTGVRSRTIIDHWGGLGAACTSTLVRCKARGCIEVRVPKARNTRTPSALVKAFLSLGRDHTLEYGMADSRARCFPSNRRAYMWPLRTS